ncbi:MAG: YeeE/YedE thiosulfate transporter family protein [Deltaproteobacteria bacterium]|nr:YeeE/YedE thiosulfate transporter family protein [Deltaproteobacteria bacterium]
MTAQQEHQAEGVGAEYAALFRRQWNPVTAGILLSLFNILLFAYAKPWNAAEGFLNWGQWMLTGFGVDSGMLVPVTLMTTSVTNLSLIAGAALSAMLSQEFFLRVPAGRDLARGLFGAVLMGIGAILGLGCTVGGFLTAYSALSLGGVLMLAGLGLGAYLGLRLLLWDMKRETPAAPKSRPESPLRAQWTRVQPYVGLALTILVVALLIWDATEFTYSGITGRRSVLVFFGLILGVVNQRSRFCFVRVFREPFMTGDAGMTKGAAAALLVGVVGFAVLKGGDIADMRNMTMEVVNPTVWFGSLVGGLVFGIGMVLAGGCGTGSLWRAGEGQLKLWAVSIVFALSAGISFRVVNASGIRTLLGEKAVFVPDMMGWAGGLLFLLVLPVVWYLLAAWNEKKGTFVIS